MNMSEEKELTPDERMQWLRDRGILIETPEERSSESPSLDVASSSAPLIKINYVRIPVDPAHPLEEFEVELSSTFHGDGLLQHLKSAFAKGGRNADLNLLQQPNTENVSAETLQQVAQEGHVEVFNLVYPTPSNKFVGINIYLDEIGMLKRLPLNHRASDYAKQAGYNPPPTFYGDVFLGRVLKRGGTMVQSLSFPLKDATPNATWLQNASTQNLEYQMELNEITGRNDVQPDVAGSNGVASVEAGYSWTQTEEELEVIVALPVENVQSKDLKVKFKPSHVEIICQHEPLVSLELLEKVDVDGCTWTLDKNKGTTSIVVTMEKVEEALWPRIQN